MELNNQLINNTGDTYSGIIFAPFSNMTPSDYNYENNMSSWSMVVSGPNKGKITPSEEGWTEKPDKGGTDLSKEAPIGDPSCLCVFAILYCIYIAIKKKRNRRHTLSILALLFTLPLSASITAFRFNPASGVRAGEELIIQPTIASVPAGSVQVCWGLYYDADCSYEVENLDFSRIALNGPNAVTCTMPLTSGTYYIKSSLHTGARCSGVLDSYYVTPIEVYPADADIVLTREAQGSASRIDITEESSKQAYGALRFSKTRLNDESVSPYERYNYFVSFPFDVKVEDIYGIGEVGTHWLLYFYDGKGRAEKGFFAERTDNWAMIDDTDSVLHAGQGYLLQLNSIQMRANNESVWVNGKDVATLYFPALSPFDEVVTANETIPALSEAYQCTIDLSASLGSKGDRRTKDSYWRCIGVPSFDSPGSVSELSYLYEWNPGDNSLNVQSSIGFNFLPTHAYLVQNGGAIIWTDVTRPMLAARQQEKSLYEWRVGLTKDDTPCDHTFLRLTESATKEFDFGQDLSKELNAGKANIYSLVGYERLAGNCMPISEQMTVVPLGVTISETGEYTFGVQESETQGTLLLTDLETGVRTNLVETSYSVYLEKGTYDKRFSLEISTSSNATTGLEDTYKRYSDPDIRKILIDGQMYIEKGGKRYNLTGLLVKNCPI